MKKLNVVIIAGLTNGKVLFDYLKNNKYVNLQLVITYPIDSNKPRHEVLEDNHIKIIRDTSANKHLEKIQELNPDLILVAGWSELLNSELLNTPEMGVIGFHPSKLPHDRGRSVLAWQIEEGYKETYLSMFFYNEKPDCGDIIGQEKIAIEQNDYINDILDKVDKATFNLLCAYFPLIRQNNAPRIKQTIEGGNTRRLRGMTDSIIDWNSNSINIYNKIRAISKPYPGAVALINNEKYLIWKAQIINDFPLGNGLIPGKLVATLYDKSILMKCRDKFILINQYEKF
jgi:methionyl-tRNA formyltransferase